MKYLLTGGCGFIGTNFAENLLKRGHSVVLVDNLSRGGTSANLGHLKNIYRNNEFVYADVRVDSDILEKLMDGVDVVYHFAGQTAVTTSVKDPIQDFYANTVGTLNVLEAIRKSDRKPIMLNASTNKVYGGMEDIAVEEGETRYYYRDLPNGIPETRYLDFHSPYGCSKGSADQYVRDYARIYGLRTVSVRQSCIYGERQFGMKGQGWLSWFTISKLLDVPITIYGNGKQVRDVLYIQDLFEAWDLITENIETTRGKVYNVGGGPQNTLSLIEFLDLLGDILDSPVNYTFASTRPGDQPVYISDITKINNELGWYPKTDVYTGSSKLITWISENADMIRKQLDL